MHIHNSYSVNLILRVFGKICLIFKYAKRFVSPENHMLQKEYSPKKSKLSYKTLERELKN